MLRSIPFKRLTRSLQAAPLRSFSLDFVPIAEFEDPLDETARSALAKSCYLKIDWKISEKATMHEAITRMSAHNIGALAVSNDAGDVVGVVSERDFLNKVGVLEKSSKNISVGSVCTYGKANLVSVTLDNPIDKCMKKMVNSNVRHLLIREKDTGKMVGMISVKDIVKCAIAKHEAVVEKLTGLVVNSESMRWDT